MLTEFGKTLRKIRIDHQELLKEMADKLEVSSAYLSAIETGKRRIPADWVNRIAELYHLDSVAKRQLVQAEDQSACEVTISLQDVSSARRGAVLTFAKALDGLSDEELTNIMTVMKKRERMKGEKVRA